MIAPLLLAALVSTTPAIRPEAWWKAEFDAERDYAATNLDARVAFVGDSITERWSLPQGTAAWNANFAAGRYKACNFGIGGDRTEHVLWRLQNGQLGGLKPKAFVLMIGTNNNGHRTADLETPIDTIRGVRRIVEYMRCHWPEAKIVLHPIFPRGATTNDATRIRNEKVNAEIRYIADGRRVIWCDFNAKFLGADGTLPREIMGDLLHPDAKGMAIWAENLLPTLDYALGYAKAAPAGCGPFERPAAKAYEPSMSAWLDYRTAPKRGEIEDLTSKRVDAVFMGDSITHLWEERAVDVQKEFLGEYGILNHGFSGDRVENILWNCENGLLDGYRADCVTVMIGTNNGGDPEADVARGIVEIVKSVRRHQPCAKVLVFNIFPRGHRPDDAGRARLARINAMLKDRLKGIADGKTVRYIPLWNEFLEPDGTLSPAVMNDYLHPTAEGYAIWARRLAAEMAR